VRPEAYPIPLGRGAKYRYIVKESKKGSKTYTYWMASWREGDKTRNVHLGSTRKMKAEVLGMRELLPGSYDAG
jgi:hypothetical protein